MGLHFIQAYILGVAINGNEKKNRYALKKKNSRTGGKKYIINRHILGTRAGEKVYGVEVFFGDEQGGGDW